MSSTIAQDCSRRSESSNLVADSAETTGLKWVAAGGASWNTYTPTWTNLTKGNGTEVSRYIDQDGLITWYYSLVFGSTSSMSTNPSVSLPATAKSGTTRVTAPNISLLDAGVQVFYGFLDFNDDAANNRALAYVWNFSLTYGGGAAITSTVPFTWATNDAIRFTVSYEKA